jgi:Phasin protein
MPPIYEARGARLAAFPTVNADVLEICQPIVAGMSQYSGALSDGYAAMGSEWLRFINRRFHIDMSLATRMSKCSSPQDLMQEWSTFMTTAADDYRNEFTRLTEMNSTASQAAMSAIHANGGSK